MGAASPYVAGASIGFDLIGGYMKADAQKQEGAYQKRIADMNADLLEMQASDRLKRGAEEESQLKSQARQTKGAQRAALAAQGVVVDDGSAADVQLETDLMSAEDSMKLRNNAVRESMGLKLQSSQMRFEGEMKKRAGDRGALMSMLTGGFSAADKYVRFADGGTFGAKSKLGEGKVK